MKNQIQYIVDEVNFPNDGQLFILMTSTHPMTDMNLCRTGYEFFNLDIPQFPIKWRPGHQVPPNMHFIKSIEELPRRPDIIISQNVVDQLPIFTQLAYSFDCPIIEFEHTVPSPQWKQMNIVQQIRNEVRPTAYTFISDYSRKDWLRADDKRAFVISHMIDTELYKGWTGHNGMAAIMCNSFAGREWAVGDIAKLMTHNEALVLFGHNPGFMSSVLHSPAEVVNTLKQFDVFVNTSLRSPIPASLLEAASIGMPIVSTKTCAIPDFFTDGVNIRFYETHDECSKLIAELLNDRKQCERLGAAARQVILEKFNEQRYIKDWEDITTFTLRNYHNV